MSLSWDQAVSELGREGEAHKTELEAHSNREAFLLRIGECQPSQLNVYLESKTFGLYIFFYVGKMR